MGGRFRVVANCQLGKEITFKKFIYLLLFFLMLFIFQRETQSVSRGGTEREGDTDPEAGSSTEPDMRLKLTNCEIMTRAKVGCLTD